MINKAEIIEELKRIKPFIKHNTYKTIKGQIKAGDLEGAKKGIERLRVENGLFMY